jgi:CBS-domain-containing membrane protein
LITALVGVVFAEYIDLPMYVNISMAVGAGVFFMIFCNVVHPPAGGNPIIVIVAGASYEYLINPIILGSFIMLALAIVINKFLLKKNYPVS